MTLDELVTLTRERLAARLRRVVEPGPLVRAAVLVPLVERGGPSLIFPNLTRRYRTHRRQCLAPVVTSGPAGPLALALTPGQAGGRRSHLGRDSSDRQALARPGDGSALNSLASHQRLPPAHSVATSRQSLSGSKGADR